MFGHLTPILEQYAAKIPAGTARAYNRSIESRSYLAHKSEPNEPRTVQRLEKLGVVALLPPGRNTPVVPDVNTSTVLYSLFLVIINGLFVIFLLVRRNQLEHKL